MSFSSEVKAELAKNISSARHCQLAELAAMLHFCGQYGRGADGTFTIGFQTENEAVVRKGFTLLKKTFNINTDVLLTEKEMQALMQKVGNLEEPVTGLLLKNTCCQRAFLRGAFLSVGSISDPEKGYHLEFVCETDRQALQIQEAIHSFDIEAKVVRRKKYDVVYLKEGAGIVDLLNVMGAHVSLMNLENLRIEKEMRNSINRQVNCETANITKTVNAASRQLEDIQLIQTHIGLSGLPEHLREIALVRLTHPESSLQELGGYLNPPVGKSGVNHRLRKLSEIASQIQVKA